jgi:CheY-like chemotaxis protein
MIKDNYIVYVEDDPDDRMLLQEAFESNKDYSLLTLVNGFELFNYLKHTEENKLPCAIVLDINMPVMNGIETLTILKSDNKYKNIPTVMYSTAATAETVNLCKSYNTDVITKPTKFTEIKKLFTHILKFCEK